MHSTASKNEITTTPKENKTTSFMHLKGALSSHETTSFMHLKVALGSHEEEIGYSGWGKRIYSSQFNTALHYSPGAQS